MEQNLNIEFERALKEEESRHFLSCPNADFLSRAAAWSVDSFFLYIIYMILLSTVNLIYQTESQHAQILQKSLLYFLLLTISFFWYVWSTSRFGASPGKVLLGLRVVHSFSGQNLNLRQSFVREFFGKWFIGHATLGIDYALCLVRSDRKTLHDLITISTVKKVRARR